MENFKVFRPPVQVPLTFVHIRAFSRCQRPWKTSEGCCCTKLSDITRTILPKNTTFCVRQMSFRPLRRLTLTRSVVPFNFLQKALFNHVKVCSSNVNKHLSDLTPTYIQRHPSSNFHTSFKALKKRPNYNKLNLKQIMADKDDKWLEVGKYSAFPWTIAGVESCVVVHGENLKVAFDMGYAVKESVNCDHVFIR